MGLDMYLQKKKVVYDEVAYWRKANAIHKWFEDHAANGEIENLNEVKVTKEMLEALLETCKKVKNDHSLAKELLPRESGFFFGSQEYDGWYFEDIESTIRQIERVLNDTDFETEEIYYSAWW